MEPASKFIQTTRGKVEFLEAGNGPPLVLLHGIGSGSASWRAQVEQFAARYRVIAWNAPGYGKSTPVEPDVPAAADYAVHLGALLDALDISTCSLVGHSLGAIMACGFARTETGRVRSLMIASPASGYGSASADLQAQRRSERLSLMNELGPEGLARERHGNLLSENAPQWARDRVYTVMSQLNPEGYRQAVELLINGDIKADAEKIPLPVTTVVGGEDTVTPPDGCKAVANSFAVSTFQVLSGLGHACYVEGPGVFNQILETHLAANA